MSRLNALTTVNGMKFRDDLSSSATSCRNLTVQPIVAALKTDGSVDTSASGTATIAAYTDAACASAASGSLSADALSVDFLSGYASFTNVNYTGESGTIYLGVSVPGKSVLCSSAISLGYGTAGLAFGQQPSPTITAGVLLGVQPIVEVKDECGNLIANASSPVTLSLQTNAACTTASTGAMAITTNPVTPSAGQATFAGLTLAKAETVYLKAVSGGVTAACSNAITVNPGVKHHLGVGTAPSSTGTAGSALAIQPVIEIQDSQNNRVNATDSVTLTAFADSACTIPGAGAVTGGGALAAVAGAATFTTIQWTKAASYYLKATSGTLVAKCFGPITIGAATATKLGFVVNPPATANQNKNFSTQPQVAVQDTYGNTVSSASDTITLSAHNSAACGAAAAGTLSATNNALATTNGVAAFSGVRHDTSVALYAKATGLGAYTAACMATSTNITAGATQLAFSTQPSSTGTAGNNLATQPVVELRDDDGVHMNGTNSITLAAFLDSTCTTAVVAGTLSATTNPLAAVTGYSTFAAVRFNKTGTIYLRASATGLTSACSQGITLSPGTATQLVFATQPTATLSAGSALADQPVVEVQDANGNRVTGASDLITLTPATSVAGCGAAATGTVLGTTAVSASSGSVNYSGISYTKAETMRFKATATGLTAACSNLVVVSHGPASKLVYTTQPAGASTKICTALPTQPVVEVQDTYGNRCTTDSTTVVTLLPYGQSTCVTAPAAGSVVNGTSAVTVSSGVATFAGISINLRGATASTKTSYLKATATGITAACSLGWVSSTTAESLVFTTQPSATGTAGTPLAVQPVVEVRDACNQKIDWGNWSVTLSAATDAACAYPAIGGTFQATSNPVTTVSRVANYAGVGHTFADSVYLKAALASPAISGCSSNVVVNPISAQKNLTFMNLPASVPVNAWITPAPVVAVADGYKNRHSGESANITLSAFSNAACTVAAPGTLTVTTNPVSTTSGQSQFAVKYDRHGTIYLKASASGYSDVCSGAIVVQGKYGRVIAGIGHGCFLHPSGAAECISSWNGYGSTYDPRMPVRANIADVVDYIPANGHHCFLIRDGRIQCYGQGANGQLGAGSTSADYAAPAGDVSTYTDFVSASAGEDFTCGARSNGLAYCWGSGANNRTGQPGTGDLTVPTQLPGVSGLVQVSAHSNGGCVLTNQGKVYCWGKNDYGQTGTGTYTTPIAAPTLVPGLRNVIQLSPGSVTHCALTADREVYCWGYNASGQVGVGVVGGSYNLPRKASTLPGVKALVGGQGGYMKQVNCVINSDDTLSCWGDNRYGATGAADTLNPTSTPALVDTGGPVAHASSNYYATCFTMRDTGQVKCMGDSYNLSDISMQNRSRSYGVFTDVPTFTAGTVTKMAFSHGGAYAYHGCALVNNDAANPLRCWGRNAAGQLGLGYDEDVLVGGLRTPTLHASMGTPVDIALGENKTCVVDHVGGLYCAGSDQYSSLGVGAGASTSYLLVPVTTGVSQVDLSADHGCAVLTSGAVSCWGRNLYGETGEATVGTETPAPVAVAGISDAIKVAVTETSSCAIVSDGGLKRVRCWGRNAEGQLGNDALGTDSVSPVYVVDVAGGATRLSGVEDIQAGRGHVCARKSDGTAWCWGRNSNGQVGMGSGTDRGFAYRVIDTLSVGLTGVTQITTTYDGACAVLSSGKARCWGSNAYGQLILGDLSNTAYAKPIAGEPSTISKLYGTHYGLCMIDSSTQKVRCGGYDQADNLPFTNNGNRIAPRVAALTPKIASGKNHTCRIDISDGSIQCWGDNTYGQLGRVGGSSNTPVNVDMSGITGSRVAVTLAAGHYHTCASFSVDAAAAGGETWCWGLGTNGQLGNAGTSSSAVPVKVAGTHKSVYLGAGSRHTCMVTTTMAVRCWGANNAGQVGDGGTTQRTQPATTAASSEGVRLALGEDFTCVTTKTGAVKCWGLNDVGQLGDGTTTSSNSAVISSTPFSATHLTAGDKHVCITGFPSYNVACWGDNTHGQLGLGHANPVSLPTEGSLSNVTAAGLASGSFHNCAARGDGSLVCWGKGTLGQLGDGNSATSASPVTAALSGAIGACVAGEGHTCFAGSTGTYCFGDGTQGQMGNGTNNSSVTATLAN